MVLKSFKVFVCLFLLFQVFIVTKGFRVFPKICGGIRGQGTSAWRLTVFCLFTSYLCQPNIYPAWFILSRDQQAKYVHGSWKRKIKICSICIRTTTKYIFSASVCCTSCLFDAVFFPSFLLSPAACEAKKPLRLIANPSQACWPSETGVLTLWRILAAAIFRASGVALRGVVL